MDETARVDQILSRVRADGGRATTARRAILQTLIDHHDTHPSVEHIASTVQRDHPDVAESTVYRFLDELERLGIVAAVRLGHGPAVYHFAEEGDHHHLVCSDCGRIIEIPQKIFDPIRNAVRRDYKFEIEPRHFTLVGRCQHCETVTSDESANRHSHDGEDHDHRHVHVRADLSHRHTAAPERA